MEKHVHPPLDLVSFERHAAGVADLLRALGNRRRLMIMCKLAEHGEMTVGALAGEVGLSQSALSQHLAVLRSEGIVATSRDGQSIRYRIANEAAVRVISTLAEIFCPPDMRNSHDRPSDPAKSR